MGAEAYCRVTFRRTKAEGKALLETDELLFRGDGLRFRIPFRSISKIVANDGALRVTCPEGTAVFGLGADAAKWAHKVCHPPARIDKLNVRSGQRVRFIGFRDPQLREEIEARGATIVGRSASPVDTILLKANESRDLEPLAAVLTLLKPDGAIWVIRPKGSARISEREVIDRGRAAGLVDVKVARFSDTHTAAKLVRRARDRSSS